MTSATVSVTTTTTTANKKRIRARDQHQPLIPGLPDDLAQLFLSRFSPSLLYSVCRSWRRLIYSPYFPSFLSLYALLSSQKTHPDSIQFSSFDPISSCWQSLPPLPPDPFVRPLLLRHPSFISRELPIQSVTASGHLVLIAATTHHLLPALSRPLIFNPLSTQWSHGPPISFPRRWCAAGSVGDSLYIASGVGSHYNQDVARSAERLDLKGNNRGNKWSEYWEKVAPLKDGKFSREAVEAVGWRGKLCMVNLKGNAPKEGIVYDVERNVWEEMSEGMLVGWNGPAAALDEDVIYVVDQSRGLLERYDEEKDCWEEVWESEQLKGAVQMAAGGGRVCVVGGGCGGVVVVDVVARPVRVWVVDPPAETQVVAVHALPRISEPEI